MKILITGGHLTPALAVIEEIKRIKPDTEIIFVGRKYAFDSEKTISLEYKEITRRKINFIPIQAGRLTRILTISSIRSFLRIPLGFLNAFHIVNTWRPDVVMSFGSYVALPIVFWSYLYKIKIYTHEQTSKPGLSNRLISFFAKKVFVSFEETTKYFPVKKVVVTGNPVRSFKVNDKKAPFMIKKDRPIIYITGGSLGSHSINIHIKNILSELLKDYIVIHQTGDTKEYRDYETMIKEKDKLPKNFSERYFPVKHLYEEEVAYVYSIADLVIGRSGANTFFELVNYHLPAVLIPLPWASGREQQHHAEILAKSNVGEIFHQIEASDKLVRIINIMMNNLDLYKNNFAKFNKLYKDDAGKYIVKQILS